MATRNGHTPLVKVHYRPIEAAIRWSGLGRHERRILEAMKDRKSPDVGDFPQWPTLRLNTERIYDAIANKELPCTIRGVSAPSEASLEDPDLTVRHVDLRAWMQHYYPDQRPEFLFSEFERQAHPVITIEAVNALLFERDALRSQLEARSRDIHAGEQSQAQTTTQVALSPRAETAYLNVVGAMLDLLLGRSPSGQAYSSFRTQESVITALVAQHGERLGISERSLESKFAAARRTLSK